MTIRSLGLLASCSLALFALTPATRASDCSGDPGHVLTLPPEVEIGTTFLICVDAPPSAVVLILISSGEGPTDTPFGELCLDFPPLASFPFVMLPSGSVCFDHYLYCDPELVGFTGYMQFIAMAPDGEIGISNQTSLTAIDGICNDIYCGFTQGGWGQACRGDNVGCLRDAYFAEVFPSGLILGDQDGSDDDDLYSLTLTSAAAVEAFLPAGSTPGTFDQDMIDPTESSAGVFAGQLAAAKLNVAFDDAGKFDGYGNLWDDNDDGDDEDEDDEDGEDTRLGDLIYVGCVDEDLLGLSVREVIMIADRVISGEFGQCGPDSGFTLLGGCQDEDRYDVDGDLIPDVSIADLNEALDALNNNFDGCGHNGGCFDLP